MHVDVGDLVDADDRVLMEVRLLDLAALERDLEPHRRAQRIDDGSLALILGGAQVHDRTDVGDDPDLVHLDLLVRVDADFCDFREVALMAEMERKPEAATGR